MLEDYQFERWSERSLQEFIDQPANNAMERELQRMAKNELDHKLKMAKVWRRRCID
jgi:hypothetical protein